MPLDEEYDEALKSNFADMANVGGRPGGAITAAMFLRRYTAKFPGRTSTSPARRGSRARRRARPGGRSACSPTSSSATRSEAAEPRA
jgi:hypothetical protein